MGEDGQVEMGGREQIIPWREARQRRKTIIIVYFIKHKPVDGKEEGARANGRSDTVVDTHTRTTPIRKKYPKRVSAVEAI